MGCGGGVGLEGWAMVLCGRRCREFGGSVGGVGEAERLELPRAPEVGCRAIAEVHVGRRSVFVAGTADRDSRHVRRPACSYSLLLSHTNTNARTHVIPRLSVCTQVAAQQRQQLEAQQAAAAAAEAAALPDAPTHKPVPQQAEQAAAAREEPLAA